MSATEAKKRKPRVICLAVLVAASLVACGAFAAAPTNAAEVAPAGPKAMDRSDSEAVRRAVSYAFEGPEFWWKHTRRVAGPQAPRLARVLKKVGQWIGDLLENVFQWLTDLLEWLWGTGELGAGTAKGLGWGVLVVVAAVAGFLLWRWRHLWARWLLAHRAEMPRGTEPAEERLPEADRLLEEAQQAVSRGDFREAIRYAFLALVAALQERGLLRYDPSRTNGEYYRELLPRPAVAERFGAAAACFDRTWYGRLPADPSEAQRLVALCEQLVRQPAEVAVT